MDLNLNKKTRKVDGRGFSSTDRVRQDFIFKMKDRLLLIGQSLLQFRPISLCRAANLYLILRDMLIPFEWAMVSCPAQDPKSAGGSQYGEEASDSKLDEDAF